MTWGQRLYHTGVLVAAIAVAVFAFDKCRDGRASEWQQRAEASLAREAVLKERVFALEAESDSLSAIAANLAEAAEAAETVIRTRTVEVRADTPPEIANHPAVVERDEIIDEQQAQIGRWKRAYEAQVKATAKLQEALDAAVERGDSLKVVLEDRPGDRPWWIPVLTVGPSLGLEDAALDIDPVRVNLGWKVSL